MPGSSLLSFGKRVFLVLLCTFWVSCSVESQTAPSLAEVSLRLPLVEFGANALLEVYVLGGDLMACAGLESDSTAPDADAAAIYALGRKPASSINNEERVTLEFPELPAEIPLVFFARVQENSATLARACQQDVVIASGGAVEVNLRVAE
jgi:hypothetical protein